MDITTLKPTTKTISRSITWKTEARKGGKCGKTLKGNRTIPRHCKSKNLKSARKYVQEYSYARNYLWDMRS